jgi:hypothetical protein
LSTAPPAEPLIEILVLKKTNGLAVKTPLMMSGFRVLDHENWVRFAVYHDRGVAF